METNNFEEVAALAKKLIDKGEIEFGKAVVEKMREKREYWWAEQVEIGLKKTQENQIILVIKNL